jgi:hypothetical protein
MKLLILLLLLPTVALASGPTYVAGVTVETSPGQFVTPTPATMVVQCSPAGSSCKFSAPNGASVALGTLPSTGMVAASRNGAAPVWVPVATITATPEVIPPVTPPVIPPIIPVTSFPITVSYVCATGSSPPLITSIPITNGVQYLITGNCLPPP